MVRVTVDAKKNSHQAKDYDQLLNIGGHNVTTKKL